MEETSIPSWSFEDWSNFGTCEKSGQGKQGDKGNLYTHKSMKFQKLAMMWMLWSPDSVICREQYKKLPMTKMLSWITDVMWLKLPCGERSYISHISQIIPRNKNNAEKLYILMLTVMKSALILNKCIKLPWSSFLFYSMMYSILHLHHAVFFFIQLAALKQYNDCLFVTEYQ